MVVCELNEAENEAERERESELASTKAQSEIVPHMKFDLYSLKFYMKANYQRAAHM